MKHASKFGFLVALVAVLCIGLGTVTVEAKVKPPVDPGTCPAISNNPNSGDIYIGTCDHPCGGICDLYRNVSGVEFYDSSCPIE